MIEIVDAPAMDRAALVAAVRRHKTTLGAVLAEHPDLAAALIVGFFDVLAPHARRLFGGSVALLVGLCTVRHHLPGNSEPAPWHTDGAGFFLPDRIGLTFWCPLDDVGERAPGVTFLTEQGEVTPRLGPGRALIIPPDVRHRTQDLDGDRLSVEFRCSPADRLPENVGTGSVARQARLRDVVGILVETGGRAHRFIV